MKRYAVLILFFAATAAANTPPTVSHLHAQQRLNSQLVDITYSVVDPEDDPLTISVYLRDGNDVTIMQCTSVSGAVGSGIMPGSNKHIVWDAGADYPGQYGAGYTLRVVADDGQTPYGFVTIPAGTFTMGSPTTEPYRSSNETQHTVTLTTPFLMAATEVTNLQYAELAQWAYDRGYCTATSGSLRDALDGSSQELLDLDGGWSEISFSNGMFTVDAGREAHPVMEVTWYGAVVYCNWLSLREGLPRAYDHATWQCNGHAPYSAQGYRLPTEAEWEYACRAGTQTPFNTGPCLDAGTEANYNGSYPYTGCPSGPYVGSTVPVGSYPPNGRGLYDMHGNLWEWCNDWYGLYGGAVTDPAGPWPGSYRVVRGGGWSYDALGCRSAYRGIDYPGYSDYSVGFRPVRSTN